MNILKYINEYNFDELQKKSTLIMITAMFFSQNVMAELDMTFIDKPFVVEAEYERVNVMTQQTKEYIARDMLIPESIEYYGQIKVQWDDQFVKEKQITEYAHKISYDYILEHMRGMRFGGRTIETDIVDAERGLEFRTEEFIDMVNSENVSPKRQKTKKVISFSRMMLDCPSSWSGVDTRLINEPCAFVSDVKTNGRVSTGESETINVAVRDPGEKIFSNRNLTCTYYRFNKDWSAIKSPSSLGNEIEEDLNLAEALNALKDLYDVQVDMLRDCVANVNGMLITLIKESTFNQYFSGENALNLSNQNIEGVSDNSDKGYDRYVLTKLDFSPEYDEDTFDFKANAYCDKSKVESVGVHDC